MQDTIEREITVRAPKERVFNAITDPKQIVAWFPDAIEGSLEPEARPIFDFGDGGKFQIYVVAVEPYDYFAYRWVPGGCDSSSGFLGDVLAHPNTLVEFRLHESPTGVLVKMKESGFASLPAEFAEKAIKDNSGGWDYMMARLATLLTEG
ncbi:MAG: SRPBCC family protein [Fimbriimonadaceae bacterium]